MRHLDKYGRANLVLLGEKRLQRVVVSTKVAVRTCRFKLIDKHYPLVLLSSIVFQMNAIKSRSRCLQQLRHIPDVRPVHVNRGRFLVSTGFHNDEQTLRHMATLLANLLPERQESVSAL